MTSLIAAVAKNYVIGVEGDLPWHLPADMQFFKKTTEGHHVIMGRKNYESIPPKYRPLPNRTNVVVTRNENYEAPDCLVVRSIEEGLGLAKSASDNEPFIIGGGEIYKMALERDLVNRMYITWVHTKPQGDTFFPEFDFKQWKVISEHEYPDDEKHNFPFSIVVYERLGTR